MIKEIFIKFKINKILIKKIINSKKELTKLNSLLIGLKLI